MWITVETSREIEAAEWQRRWLFRIVVVLAIILWWFF
jgi:hypothetical protein